jgi:hypothetical protein
VRVGPAGGVNTARPRRPEKWCHHLPARLSERAQDIWDGLITPTRARGRHESLAQGLQSLVSPASRPSKAKASQSGSPLAYVATTVNETVVIAQAANL